MRQLVRSTAAVIVGLGLGAGLPGVTGWGTAKAAEAIPVPSFDWSFSGVFGTFDQGQLQRGFQVFKENCAACHSLDRIAFRNFSALGYNEDELKALASEYEVIDGPDDEGEMFMRPAIPSDYWPSPFPNERAAAAANGGAVPPDLSLIAKARAGGANHVKAVLVGYEEFVSEAVLQSIFESETEKRIEQYESALEEYERRRELYEERVLVDPDAREPTQPEQPQPVESVEDLGLPPTATFNAYFPGYAIAMAPPLSDDLVEYGDGTPATTANMSADVSAFLMWAAEPSLVERKEMGIKVILFLLVFTGILYAAKRKCWSDLH